MSSSLKDQESSEVVFQWTLTKSDNDQNLMLGVYLSIKTNSLTIRNISLFTVIDLSTPLNNQQDAQIWQIFMYVCLQKCDKTLLWHQKLNNIHLFAPCNILTLVKDKNNEYNLALLWDTIVRHILKRNWYQTAVRLGFP